MKLQSVLLSGAGALLLAMAAATSAVADELPQRKAGLWEIKMTHAKGAQGSPARQCTDASFEKEAGVFADQMMTCSKRDIRKTAAGYTVDSECKIMGMTTTSRTEITGDFNSAYKMKQTARTQGGIAGKAGQDSDMMIEGKWLGPCPAGWKPGDMEVDGKRMSLKEIMQ